MRSNRLTIIVVHMLKYILLSGYLGLGSVVVAQTAVEWINASGTTIETRIKLPKGYERLRAAPGSFAEYLRQLPLKPAGSEVLLFNGQPKAAKVHVAVLTVDVGIRDLQQCADAVMRLRADYLFAQKRYQDIQFHFTNGFNCPYSKWREGYRVKVSGNQVSWWKKGGPDYSYRSFRSYLDLIYTYAGTLSLEKELKSVPFQEMEIGDVLIRGGSPGHAVIVVDLVRHVKTGEKLYLLAQSYMPAQDIHLLQNPMDAQLSPWYRLATPGDQILTPEWSFTKQQLRRF